tara:strand:- start:145 stop:453 length:309 start_codon:yes stop_codon:yes gene_type:complete
MADFFDNLNKFLTKDFVSELKKVLENPNNLSENIISYLKKNKIDLNNIIDTIDNANSIDCDSFKDENINIQNDSNDYENLFLRLDNIENIMTEIQEYLQKDN